MKAKGKKILWRGVYNFSHSILVRYAWAFSLAQAHAVMCRRIAKEHGVGYQHVFSVFDGSKPNYEIKEERND